MSGIRASLERFHASVVSQKFVEKISLSKWVPGKAQSTVMPRGIASICNAAWDRFRLTYSTDLSSELLTQDTRVRVRQLMNA